jgi:FeS assembly protein SufD
MIWKSADTGTLKFQKDKAMTVQHYKTLFSEIASQLPGHQLEFIRHRRETALAEFIETGFPTKKIETWRYTPLRKLIETPFSLNVHPVTPTEKLLAPLLESNSYQKKCEDILEYVFINGQFSRQRSRILQKDLNANLKSMNAFMEEDAQASLNFSKLINISKPHAFTLLNDAFMQDGAFIEVPEGKNITVHLLFLTTGESTFSATYLRNLIILHRGATATVIETYLGECNHCYLTNTVTQAVLHESSTLTHYKLQNESKQAFHFGTTYVNQLGSRSEFSSHVISLGGLLSRSDTHAVLATKQATCRFNGLYQLGDHQHMDHYTSIDHQQSHCTSRQLYKGILDGKSQGVFNGIIYVREGAEKTDSQQHNENLLLSKFSEIDTKPQLEIFADDVKCAHGATVGQLDEAALFYLRSRGLDEKSARQLLMTAFFSDVLSQITHPFLKERITQCL